MNVNLENKGNVEAIIKVAVEPADYTDKVKKELKRFADTHVIPGFRKGKVPMDQLRRRFGKQIKSEVINDLVYREVVKYIQDNHLHILGEPLPLEIKEITLEDEPYEFGYEVGLTPTFNVEVDKGVTLPYYTITVSDEMKAEQDKALRERFATQGPGDEVDDRAIVKGVIMELNEDGTVKETEDAIQVVNGIVAPFYFKDKDQEALFLGKHVDDKVVFNPYKTCDGSPVELSSMLNVDKDVAAGIKGDFQMTITEIIVARPAEHNQEFYDNVFGTDKVHNEEEYDAAVGNMIADALASNSRQFFADTAREYYIKKYKDTELPDEFLKKWLKGRNEELNDENIDAEYAQMRDSLIWQLVQNEISVKMGIQVQEEDILSQAKAVAAQQFAQYGMSNLDDQTITDYAKRMLADESFRNRLADSVAENKIFGAIHANVTVDNHDVTLDEFKALVNKDSEA